MAGNELVTIGHAKRPVIAACCQLPDNVSDEKGLKRGRKGGDWRKLMCFERLAEMGQRVLCRAG